MAEKIGIFGGTFDPPHIGHQILAAEACYQLGLKEVLWVLTPNPPHKRKRRITPLRFRLEMVQAAVADYSGFELSRIEIDRPAPHYSVDTVSLLQAQHPEVKIVYLMGGDSLGDLPTWFASQQFVAACHSLGVMRRPGNEVNLKLLENQIPGITKKIQFVEAPLLGVSASQIRSRIRQKKPFRCYLPNSVYKIIQEHNLYEEAS